MVGNRVDAYVESISYLSIIFAVITQAHNLQLSLTQFAVKRWLAEQVVMLTLSAQGAAHKLKIKIPLSVNVYGVVVHPKIALYKAAYCKEITVLLVALAASVYLHESLVCTWVILHNYTQHGLYKVCIFLLELAFCLALCF